MLHILICFGGGTIVAVFEAAVVVETVTVAMGMVGTAVVVHGTVEVWVVVVMVEEVEEEGCGHTISLTSSGQYSEILLWRYH